MMGECNKPGDQLDSPKWPNIIEKFKKKKKSLSYYLSWPRWSFTHYFVFDILGRCSTM